MRSIANMGPYVRRHVGGIVLCLIVILCSLHARKCDGDWTEIHVTPRSSARLDLNLSFFPRSFERKQGNAAVILLRLASTENPRAWKSYAAKLKCMLAKERAEFTPQAARVETPLVDFSELRRAAYCREASWQYPSIGEQLNCFVDIPGMSNIRVRLRGLAVDCRADIAEGKLDDAVEKITVGLGVIAHCEAAPIALAKVIQIDNASLFLDRIEEMQQHSKSPNLYWALSQIPAPFINLHTALDWERHTLHRETGIKELEDICGEQEWKIVRQRLQRIVSEQTSPRAFVLFERGDAAQPLAGDLATVREQLLETLPSLIGKVPKMSEDELIVNWFFAMRQAEWDRILRGMLLPPPQGLPLIRKAYRRHWAMQTRPVYSRQVPEITDIYTGAWSLRRRIDILRIVEAIRDFAARNGGVLPESLEAITELPVPDDVMTAQPFRYCVTDGIAYLHGEAVNMDSEVEDRLRYRIELRENTGSRTESRR